MEIKEKESSYRSKIWLKSYDKEVQPVVEWENISLADTFKNSVRDFPDSLCYEFLGTTATFKEVESYIKSFAYFLEENGFKKGDVISISMPNCPQYVIALYGAFYAGLIVSGMNFLLSPAEIIYQLSDCGAKAMLTLDAYYEEKVREALVTGKTNLKAVITTNITDLIKLNPVIKFLGKKLGKIPSAKQIVPIEGINLFHFKEIMSNYKTDTAPDVKIDPKKDYAFLQYTGGTTGKSKGAMLTHENEVANIQQVIHWWEVEAQKGKDIFLSGFPFFHLAGLFMNLGAIAYAGCQLLIANPRDTSHMIKLIEKWKPQIMVNVPTLYLMLIQDPKFKQLDLSSVRVYVSGAAPFPSESIREFESIVGEHKLLEVYGMTEASPIATMNPYLGERKIGWVGLPVSSTKIKIVDVSDKNKEVPLGEAGEIAIYGPQIFKGYWNKPDETKNALREGYFYTGDVGIMDEEGYLKIVDRTKDMIIVSGFKVFSVEVDDKMNKYPAIELASCVGLPDPNRPGSEIVKLFVKLREGTKPTDKIKDDILNYAKENLAKYKIPKIIEFVPDIPLTVIGKVDKKALRSS